MREFHGRPVPRTPDIQPSSMCVNGSQEWATRTVLTPTTNQVEGSSNGFRGLSTAEMCPRFVKPPAPRPVSRFSENLLCQTIFHVFEMRVHRAKKLSAPILKFQ